jgi:hypothetical protein
VAHCKIPAEEMTANTSKNFARAINLLEDTGLLHLMGSEIPDVCRLVTSERIKGSWWGDPAGHEIFAISEMLADHPDITVTKLISGKVTFVHRKLWQKLVAVGRARDEWQMRNLTSQGRLLLRRIDKEGSLITNKLGPSFGKKPGDTARELELRLLIHSDQIHTESGSHAKILETWEEWAKRVGLRKRPLESSTARRFFEKRIEEINNKYSGCGRLPWQPKKK